MRLPLFASIGKGTLGFLMVVTSIVAAMIYAQLHWDELRNKRRQVEQDEHSAAMAEYARKAKADQIAALYDQDDRDDFYGWHRHDEDMTA